MLRQLFIPFCFLGCVTIVIIGGGAFSGFANAPTCVPGDVNGDQVLDVSDPIYLIGHLFASGPAPALCSVATGALPVGEAPGRFVRRHGLRTFCLRHADANDEVHLDRRMGQA